MKDIFGNDILIGDVVAYTVRRGHSSDIHVGMCVNDKKFVCCAKNWNDKWEMLKEGGLVSLSCRAKLVRVRKNDISIEQQNILYRSYLVARQRSFNDSLKGI